MQYLILGLTAALTALHPVSANETDRVDVAQLYGWGPGYSYPGGYGYGYAYGYGPRYYPRPSYAPSYGYGSPYGYSPPGYTVPQPYNAPEPYNAPPAQTPPAQLPEMDEGAPAETDALPQGVQPTTTPPGPRTSAPQPAEEDGDRTAETAPAPMELPPVPLRLPPPQTPAERQEALKQVAEQRRALQLRRQAEAREKSFHIAAPGTLHAPAPDRKKERIKVVFTGHSVATASGEKVYLAGVRTPFFAVFDGIKPEPGGKEAYGFTRQRTEGLEVELVDDAPLSAAAGKRCAYVYLPDGTMLNEELLKLGLAKVDNAHPFARMREFKQFESQARARRSGLWK